MSIAARLAWRNLWRHGRRTWLTVGAMVFCNALLVFLISLQVGSYAMMIDGTLSILTGHLQVQHRDYNEEPRMRYGVPEGVALAQRLRQTIGAEGVAARASAFALASSFERSFGVQLMGVQPEREASVSTLPGLVTRGRYLRGEDSTEIVLGSVLARNLKVGPGDELTFIGSGRDGSFAAGIAEVVGIIDSGVTELDRAIAQIPLGFFQDSFAMDGEVHAVVMNLPRLDEVPRVKAEIASLLPGPELAVRDWDELQPGLRQAIIADLTSAFVMYAVLIVLVAFSVLNTQLMSVLERTREFGVMMALGLRPGRLARLVLLETAAMSTLGLLLGCLLGVVITGWFAINGLYVPGMEEAMARYNLPGRMYPQISLLTVLPGPGIVYLCGMLAALYPALRLHLLQPVSAMRAV